MFMFRDRDINIIGRIVIYGFAAIAFVLCVVWAVAIVMTIIHRIIH